MLKRIETIKRLSDWYIKKVIDNYDDSFVEELKEDKELQTLKIPNLEEILALSQISRANRIASASLFFSRDFLALSSAINTSEGLFYFIPYLQQKNEGENSVTFMYNFVSECRRVIESKDPVMPSIDFSDKKNQILFEAYLILDAFITLVSNTGSKQIDDIFCVFPEKDGITLCEQIILSYKINIEKDIMKRDSILVLYHLLPKINERVFRPVINDFLQ